MTMTRRTFGGLVAALGILLATIAIGLGANGQKDARAIAPCYPRTNTAEEVQLVSMVENWRAGNVQNPRPLIRSAQLNASAAGYAQYLANHRDAGLFGDAHSADGAGWNERALQCGYPADLAGGGGEAIAMRIEATPTDLTASEALAQMTSTGGSGLNIPGAELSFEYRCVGVAKEKATTGLIDAKVAWVFVIFAVKQGQSCPGETGLVQTPAPSATATAATATATRTPSATTSASASPTGSPTATRTPTQTATPTQTPLARYNVELRLVPGEWNLVTLPPGPLEEVLARAHGCIEAVYQLKGETWTRWSADVPGYARSLVISDGGAVWLRAAARDCGTIFL